MTVDFRVGALALALLGTTLLAGAVPANAAQASVYPLTAAGYMPDSVVESADGAIWFSAAQLKQCSGSGTCQSEELGTLRGHGIVEQNLGPTTLAGTYGATPGPGPSIWVTDALKVARVFDLSGRPIATVRVGGGNGSGALSAPFIGPDGRMWLSNGSFGQGGGGVVAVDAAYKIVGVAPCHRCFFAGGVVAADSSAWLLDPYLGGFYRVTSAGSLTRFDFGKFVLQTLVAGPNGNLWGTQNQGIAEYDLRGKRLRSFSPKISVQSGLRAIGGNLVWSNFGPSTRANDELDIVTMTPAGNVTVRRFANVGNCSARSRQWFSSGPAIGPDGALYVGVGCATQQAPYTTGGRGFIVRVSPSV